MIDTAAQPVDQPGRRRTWLGDTQPTRIEHDDWITYVDWDLAVDTALAALRGTDPVVDALLRIAEQDGLAIVPVWPDENSDPRPLTELALTTTDTDWIMVCANDMWRASFTADMIVDPLAPTSYERHRTPAWTVFITAH